MAKTVTDQVKAAFAEGWMQGWIDSGCAAPPRQECAPALPDRLMPQEAVGGADEGPRDAHAWRSNPHAHSAIIVRSATIIHHDGEEPYVVKFASLPNAARVLRAHGTPAGDGKAAWVLTLTFYVDNQHDKRVFDKKYALLTVGSLGSLQGAHLEDTLINFDYQDKPYFLFRCL